MANYQLLLGRPCRGAPGIVPPLRQNNILTGRSSVVIRANELYDCNSTPPDKPDPQKIKKLNLKYDMQHLPQYKRTVGGRFATQMQHLGNGWFTLYCSSESCLLLSIWSIQDQITDPLPSIAPSAFFLYFILCLIFSVLLNNVEKIKS